VGADEQLVDPRFLAALKFIERTGASQLQVRYSDDEPPTIWMVVAVFNGQNPTGIRGAETDAATDPIRAALRLCERLADGAQCTHCHRMTGFDPDSLETMPMNDVICWYQYDPGAKKFIRGCA
jgi:hypothetical protein